MNLVVKLIVNAVMVNAPATDVKRASPATAAVNVIVVKKYAAALNNLVATNSDSKRVFYLQKRNYYCWLFSVQIYRGNAPGESKG
jgi:hypothetical protein